MLKGLRQIKAEEMLRMAAFLGVEPPAGSLSTVPTVSVEITHVVASGVWRDEGALMLHDDTRIPIVAIPRYKSLPQHAVRVEGTDFAKTVRPGQYVIYVPMEHIRRKPLEGDVVFVQRSRNDLTEFSLRRVRYDHENVMELHSEPEHGISAPIRVDTGTTEHIEILGLCIGIYAPL